MNLHTETVEYQHEGTVLEGYIAWDDSTSEPRPGVLVSHAWAGRSAFEQQKAEELARLGYVGFALDLYGKGVLGSSNDENAALMQPFMEDRQLLLARLQASLAALRACPATDASRSAIIGYCFGGLCALDLARSGSDILAAISIHGLLNAPAKTADISARVLALHGWDDPMATPQNVQEFASEMTKAGADWQLHAYGNTMHAFTNPQANDPDFGTVYNADADRRSWIAIRNMLSEALD